MSNLLKNFCINNKLIYKDFSNQSEKTTGDVADYYEWRGGENLLGIRVKKTGEFGNNVIQTLHAIYFVRKFNLKYLKLDGFGAPFKAGTHILNDGIHVYISESSPKLQGAEIYGRYFSTNTFFQYLDDLQPQVAAVIINNEISRLLDISIQEFPPNTLSLHVRGGSDQFGDAGFQLGNKGFINKDYVQPPLSFYIKVLNCFQGNPPLVVNIVARDFSNPVLVKLIDYTKKEKINFKLQMESLKIDLETLVNSTCIAGGYGSFIPMISLLSKSIREVYFFRELQHENRMKALGKSPKLVQDKCGHYTKRGQWVNSIDQRRMLLEYPIDCLKYE